MFRSTALSILVTALVASGCGSSSDGSSPDSGTTPPADTGGGPVADNGVTPPAGDTGVTPPPAADPLLESVLQTMTLPVAAGDYAMDLDGSGAKNQLGALLVAVSAFGMALQPEIDRVLEKGELLILMEVLGTDLTNDSDVTIKAHLGEDTDGDADNNFGGSAALKIAANSPTDAKLQGAIAAGKLTAGPGTLLVPLPLGSQTVVVPVIKAAVKAEITASGLTAGVIGGALAQAELEGKVLPGVVALINESLADSSISQKNKDTMLSVLDADKNGKIELADMKAGLIGTALAPDIDTDGDGAPDALSLGFGFTAVGCAIQR